MSVQIIQKCDRCGATATIDSDNDYASSEKLKTLNFQNVGVGIMGSSQNSTGPKFFYFLENQISVKAQWCMKCCIEVGLALPPEERDKNYLERMARKFIEWSKS